MMATELLTAADYREASQDYLTDAHEVVRLRQKLDGLIEVPA